MKTIIAIERESPYQCLIQTEDSKKPTPLMQVVKDSPGLLENFYSIQTDPFPSDIDVKANMIESSNHNRIQNLIEDGNYLEAIDTLLYHCSVGQFPPHSQVFSIIEYFIQIIQSKTPSKKMSQTLTAECIHKFCDLLKCLEAYHTSEYFINVYQPLVPNHTTNDDSKSNVELDMWNWIENLITPKDHELLGTLSIILLNHFSRIFSEDISLNKFHLNKCFLLSLIPETDAGQPRTQIRKVVHSLLSTMTDDYSIPYMESQYAFNEFGSDTDSSKMSAPSVHHSVDSSEDEVDIDHLDHSKRMFYDEFWIGMEGAISIFQQLIYLSNSELICINTVLRETYHIFEKIPLQPTKNWFLQAIPSPVFKVQLIDLILTDQYLAAVQANQLVMIDCERILNNYLAPDLSKMISTSQSHDLDTDDTDSDHGGLSLSQLEQYPLLIHQLLLNFSQYTIEYTKFQAYPEFFELLQKIDSKLVTLDQQIKIIGRLSLDWPKRPLANIGKFIKYAMIGFPYPGKRKDQF